MIAVFSWLPFLASLLHGTSASPIAAPRQTVNKRTGLNTNLAIVPNATWTATNTGEMIQAHGTGFIEVDGTYYIVGENKTSGASFQSINCYSSTDLVQWTFVNELLSLQPSGDLGPNRVVERPKVLYNDVNKNYVLWMHIDNSDYSEAKVGVATSQTVCGDYNYISSWQPLGHQSRDMSLFKDQNGDGYLLTEDRQNGLRIDKLSDDYLNVTEATYLFSSDLEAPAMIYQNGLYYVFASYLTGWANNNNVYSTASSIAGPWSSFQNFATPNTNTFESQTAYVLQTPNGVMFAGDRWEPNNFIQSSYVWLPMVISGTSAQMLHDYENWLPSTFASGPAMQSYAGSGATYANGARQVSCSGCVNGAAAGWIGGPSGGSVTYSGITSSSSVTKTMQLSYENGDSTQRFALVSVNGGTPQRVAFVPSSSGSTPGVSVVQVTFKQGSSNTIKITGLGDGTYGPDISEISIPQF